ncbi:hypothetical protein HID58_026976 [Brassica napus]|uniref:Cysteine proteinase inhibitor n=1 Tax=Brassica napus TaxID=3708 RepID=A0ABQ8CQJ5_BRANA|nr:hypothetical protein HID58_026976 [Brassica napus]
MKTSMRTIVFFVVIVSVSAISLAKQSPLEDCIRRNIVRSLSPPSKKNESSNFEVSDKLCRDESRTIILNHSKKLLNSLTCTRGTTLVDKKKSYVHKKKRRVALSLSPSPSKNNPDTSHFDVMRDQLCRHETRVIMHFLEMNGKFPTYYVEALYNVFGGDEKKVKVYVIRKWLDHSKKLVDSLTCASP